MRIAALVLAAALLTSGCNLFPGIGHRAESKIKMPDVSKMTVTEMLQPEMCGENDTVVAVKLSTNGKNLVAVAYYWGKRGPNGWEFDKAHPFIVVVGERGKPVIYLSTKLDGYAQHRYTDVNAYTKVWGDDPCNTVRLIKEGKS
jgi:hypothetical protein